MSDLPSIVLWMVYDVSRSGLVSFGMSQIYVEFPGLTSICQSFSNCSSDDRSDWGADWSLRVV